MLHDTHIGCVGAVGGAEGVVDVAVGEGCEIRRKALVVFLFFISEAQVFQKTHVAGRELPGHAAHIVVHHRAGKHGGDPVIQHLFRRLAHRLHGKSFVVAALGAAPMAH